MMMGMHEGSDILAHEFFSDAAKILGCKKKILTQ
jgi:hypothetical protein